MLLGVLARVTYDSVDAGVLCSPVFHDEAESNINMRLPIWYRVQPEPVGPRRFLFGGATSVDGTGRHATVTTSTPNHGERKVAFYSRNGSSLSGSGTPGRSVCSELGFGGSDVIGLFLFIALFGIRPQEKRTIIG